MPSTEKSTRNTLENIFLLYKRLYLGNRYFYRRFYGGGDLSQSGGSPIEKYCSGSFPAVLHLSCPCSRTQASSDAQAYLCIGTYLYIRHQRIGIAIKRKIYYNHGDPTICGVLSTSLTIPHSSSWVISSSLAKHRNYFMMHSIE